MLQKKWFSYTGLVIVAAIWGTNFGVSRYAMETFDPILFTFLCFGLAVPFFFLLLWVKEGNIGITLVEVGVMYSIKYTTLANSSLLNVALWPIFAALLALGVSVVGALYNVVCMPLMKRYSVLRVSTW